MSQICVSCYGCSGISSCCGTSDQDDCPGCTEGPIPDKCVVNCEYNDPCNGATFETVEEANEYINNTCFGLGSIGPCDSSTPTPTPTPTPIPCEDKSNNTFTDIPLPPIDLTCDCEPKARVIQAAIRVNPKAIKDLANAIAKYLRHMLNAATSGKMDGDEKAAYRISIEIMRELAKTGKLTNQPADWIGAIQQLRVSLVTTLNRTTDPAKADKILQVLDALNDMQRKIGENIKPNDIQAIIDFINSSSPQNPTLTSLILPLLGIVLGLPDGIEPEVEYNCNKANATAASLKNSLGNTPSIPVPDKFWCEATDDEKQDYINDWINRNYNCDLPPSCTVNRSVGNIADPNNRKSVTVTLGTTPVKPRGPNVPILGGGILPVVPGPNTHIPSVFMSKQ